MKNRLNKSPKRNPLSKRIKSFSSKIPSSLKQTFFAIIVGFIIGGIVIYWSGFKPFEAIQRLLVGGFGSKYYLTTTLTRSIPIIFASLSAGMAWGSGYPSMGASGQMIFGALVASQVAIIPSEHPVFIVIAALICGAGAGMLYSFLAGWISERFKLYLLITTLMMNYIADNVASYLTHYMIKDPFGLDSSAIQTQKIESAILPRLFEDYTLHWGFIISIAIVILLWFVNSRTVFGYRARMGGTNALFTEYGGVNSKKMMYGMLLLCGALAGLGGACEVLGNRFRYIDGMISSSGYVWSGIISSIIANYDPIGMFFSSIFLAGLITGGSAVERSMGVPSEVSAIIQSIITLLITAKFALNRNFRQIFSQHIKNFLSVFQKNDKRMYGDKSQ